MSFRQIVPVNIDKLQSELLINGLLQIKPRIYYAPITRSQIDYFMYLHGIYCLPTQELIDWLRVNIVGIAIEIGAGNGAIGRALGIPITDSKMQEETNVQLSYSVAQQPVIRYPDDIEKLSALEAVEKYKPDTVLGSYITHKYDPARHDLGGNMYGVDGIEMMRHIKRYIMVGNLDTHLPNPLFKRRYKSFPATWLITRTKDQSKNRIFTFEPIA